MSKGNTFCNDFLLLIFNATAIANIADNAASGALTDLEVSLHTANVGETGSQTTNETAYAGYARVPVARTSGGWTVSGTQVVPAANIVFPVHTGGASSIITHFAVGTAHTSTGKVLYYGVLGGQAKPFTATDSGDAITVPDIVFIVDDRVAFYPLKGQSLPTGMTEGTVYFVKTVTGSVITVSTTSGGSTLALSADGAGVAKKVTPLTVSTGIAPILTTSTVITED